MDKISDATNLGYSSYIGQIKSLRKIAIEKFGAEKVAMMSNDEVAESFRREGYVPLCIHLDNDGCNSEMIFLVKEDKLVESKDVIILYR